MVNHVARLAPLARLAAVLVVAGWHSGCALCANDAECGFGQVCLQGGGCVPAPVPTMQVLTAPGDVVDGWPLTLEIGFRGVDAVVEIERSSDDPGDPCIPFGVVRRIVQGTPDAFTSHVVIIPGMPALGPTFTLVIRATVAGETLFARTTMQGPPTDAAFTGITVEEPRVGDVDVVFDPLIPVVVTGDGLSDIAVHVEASTETSSTLAGNGTPLQFLIEGRGEVPALRGPHIVWAEATVDGQRRRCGRAMQGGPNDLASNELEVYLLTASRNGTDAHLVELSTRVVSEAGVAVCDGRAPSAVPCLGRVNPPGPAPAGRDSLQVALSDGVIEVAVVPRIVSGPVDAMVRLSRGGTHLGVLGPITLLPELGEVWLAGRVVIDGDAVVAVVPETAPPSPGLPW